MTTSGGVCVPCYRIRTAKLGGDLFVSSACLKTTKSAFQIHGQTRLSDVSLFFLAWGSTLIGKAFSIFPSFASCKSKDDLLQKPRTSIGLLGYVCLQTTVPPSMPTFCATHGMLLRQSHEGPQA